MFEYLSDAESMIYIFDPHTSIQETEEFIANYYMEQPLGFYALEHKLYQKLIGVIEFRIKDKKNEGEIGFLQKSITQGAYEAKGQMIDVVNYKLAKESFFQNFSHTV